MADWVILKSSLSNRGQRDNQKAGQPWGRNVKAEEEKVIEAALAGTLTRTGDWLKFAEAKHAALLTFSSAWLLAMGNLAFGANSIPEATRHALGWAAPFVFLAAGIAVYALMPRIRLWGSSTQSPKSLLFYGDLCDQKPGTLVKEMHATYCASTFTHYSEVYLEDLAEQVVSISAVAKAKYRLFGLGACSILLSLTLFFVLAYGDFISSRLVSLVCRH